MDLLLSSWCTTLALDGPPPHSPGSRICIDGVLYYGAYLDLDSRKLTKDHAVMSFDVRSKKFDLIKLPQGRATQFTRMIRYNGKVAIMLSGGFQSYPGRIELWVLEDAAKHGWSNQNFVLPLLADRNTMCQVFCVINDDAGEVCFGTRDFACTTILCFVL
ncbi:unnamed protein product [Brassica rapa]|uniref:F-box associated beta-propeller type 3 domain-containing protein n=1 Tax=Brassica campestris TaxID=3711 RepID=A0A3P6CCE5_BRACM|nr:unnamed protein product [Brassica rapa]VDD13086.1 unnamed protein product [Brassica rapa]